MKTILWITAGLGIALLSGAWAMALDAPAGLVCEVKDGYVSFTWDEVPGADKYSVDVEVPIYLEGSDTPYRIVELSFGTSDRMDGYLMNDPFLDVPLNEFSYLNGSDDDPWLDLLSGPATAKVKALNPGKQRGRQDHVFSDVCEFTLP